MKWLFNNSGHYALVKVFENHTESLILPKKKVNFQLKCIWIFKPKISVFCLMRHFWIIFKHCACNISLLRKDEAFQKEKVRLFSASFFTMFPSKFWVLAHLFRTKCECKLPSSPKCKECVRLGEIWVFFISGTPSLKIIDVTSTKWLSNKYRMVSLKN